MRWTDLWIAAAGMKVAARLAPSGDLQSFSGRVAIGPEPDVLGVLAARSGTWVTCAPMTETVKDVDESGLVRATVARDGLAVVGFPVVVDSALVSVARTPDDLLRQIVRNGATLNRL